MQKENCLILFPCRRESWHRLCYWICWMMTVNCSKKNRFLHLQWEVTTYNISGRSHKSYILCVSGWNVRRKEALWDSVTETMHSLEVIFVAFAGLGWHKLQSSICLLVRQTFTNDKFEIISMFYCPFEIFCSVYRECAWLVNSVAPNSVLWHTGMPQLIYSNSAKH